MDLVVLAPSGFESVVKEEAVARVLEQHGRLFLLKGREPLSWAQNHWFEPEILEFESIGEAAKHLRSIQRNWWLYSVAAHRRAKLIQDKLPPLRPKPISFPSALPKAPMGSWTLLDERRLLFSSKCSNPYPDGELVFEEDKAGPPSRAYLKLWEIFQLEQTWPSPGEKVFDLGSSPGGWTWVLDQLGCQVVSVDKAPLDASVLRSSRVRYLNESAFALKPEAADWLFSDVICYPDRLLELVRRWSPVVRKLVCTIKFQGPTEHGIVSEFLKIPGSRVRHLSCNKHELTWYRI